MGSVRIADSTNRKMTRAQELAQSKIARCNDANKMLLQRWEEFHTKTLIQRDDAVYLCNDRQFYNHEQLWHMARCFEMEDNNNNTELSSSSRRPLGHSVAYDMKHARAAASRRIHAERLARLLDTQWFSRIVMRFKEFAARMHNMVPASCVRFLSVFQHLIMLGFKDFISADVFYTVLESTVTSKEDHRKQIVHIVLKAVRDVVNITTIMFIKYLESKDIQPPPDLVNQLRADMELAKRGQQGVVLSVSVPTCSTDTVTSSYDAAISVAQLDLVPLPAVPVAYSEEVARPALLSGCEDDLPKLDVVVDTSAIQETETMNSATTQYIPATDDDSTTNALTIMESAPIAKSALLMAIDEYF
jgi:hypothetical protein